MKEKYSPREYWIALGLALGANPRAQQDLLKRFSSPQGIFDWAKNSSLRECDLAFASWQRLCQFDFRKVSQEEEVVKSLGAILCTHEEGLYPKGLREISDPPAFITVLGRQAREFFKANTTFSSLSVVGSRKCSAYGRMVTQSLVRPLAKAGYIMVSGGAYGIDAVVHQTVLDVEGRTVVVLGSGLAELYPRLHRELFRKIAEKGVLISEFACKETAHSYYFPQRNRLIAALAAGVLVTEAAQRSGSLITARLALEQGKDVMAVPGPVHLQGSQGTNRLIQEGAHLVREAKDVAELMGWTLSANRVSEITPVEKKVLEGLGNEAILPQLLIDRLQLTPAQLAEALMDLVNKGWAMQMPGGRWIRSIQGSEQLWQKP